jgi:hypothetical protein
MANYIAELYRYGMAVRLDVLPSPLEYWTTYRKVPISILRDWDPLPLPSNDTDTWRRVPWKADGWVTEEYWRSMFDNPVPDDMTSDTHLIDVIWLKYDHV